MGLYRLGEELLDSSLQMLRTVPYPALIFLFIVWFGVGEASHVYLIALATLFPISLNTFNGVPTAPPSPLREGLLRRVVVPLAMPSIMTGLRFSAGISVIALVFTESIGASQGIGYLVSQANSLQQIPILVVCIIIYALIGITADISVLLAPTTSKRPICGRSGARPPGLEDLCRQAGRAAASAPGWRGRLR